MNKKQKIKELEERLNFLREQFEILNLITNVKDHKLLTPAPYPSINSSDNEYREIYKKQNYNYKGCVNNTEIWVKDEETKGKK